MISTNAGLSGLLLVLLFWPLNPSLVGLSVLIYLI